nr:hypothetical protein CFP56_11936 [Quercus suber]
MKFSQFALGARRLFRKSRLRYGSRASFVDLILYSFRRVSPHFDGGFSDAALLLAGCTVSNASISNIYLASFRYSDQSSSSSTSSSLFQQATTGGQVTVRAGYFGLCAQNGNQDSWVCADGASGLGLALVDGAVLTTSRIGAAALTGLAFVLLATFPGWHVERDQFTGSDIEIKPFPSRPVTLVAFFTLALATLFVLASALWQHVASASAAALIESTSQGYLSGHVGPAAAALVWASLVLVLVACLGIFLMIQSIDLLDKLTD